MSKSDEAPAKKKRGLSVDDKRRVLLNLYHEKSEPFNMKELESLGSKAGIVQQTIKDVNQSLIDDSLVFQDKIGTINIYWSFPVKTIQDQMALRDQLIAEKQQQQQALRDLQEKIENAKQARVAPDRKEKLQELQEILRQEKELDQQLEQSKANDPELVLKIQQQANINKQAADRWTDNIFAVKSYLVKKRGLSTKEVNNFLHIDSSFDYVEENENFK